MHNHFYKHNGKDTKLVYEKQSIYEYKKCWYMFHIIGVCFTKKGGKKSACTQHQVANINPKFPVSMFHSLFLLSPLLSSLLHLNIHPAYNLLLYLLLQMKATC
jgi:hypothetical protein